MGILSIVATAAAIWASLLAGAAVRERPLHALISPVKRYLKNGVNFTVSLAQAPISRRASATAFAAPSP